jgi:hypothetical protein
MPAAKPALDEWLPKEAAAKLLGVKLRSLEKRASQGYVEKQVQPRHPSERAARVLYSRADILALKSGTPNVHAREVVENRTSDSKDHSEVRPASTALAVRNGPRDPDHRGIVADLALILSRHPEYAQPATLPGPFVSLAEAVKLSGMPESWLVAQARSGVPWAVNVGTGKREFWRFSIAGWREFTPAASNAF